MSELQSTGRRREVGAALKRIRQERGWPAYKLAERLDWTPSHISRSEAGKRKVTDVDAGYYLGMCGAPNGEVQEVLKAVNEPDDYRLQLHEGRLPDQLRSLIFHENTCTQMHSFESVYIPGMLQTANYARALIKATGLAAPPEIEGLVQIRIARSDVLDTKNPPKCMFFVHEHALRSLIGGPRVMNEQLLNLLFMGDRPECAIRVVPISAGAAGMNGGGFLIFGYKDDPPSVYVSHATTSEFLENDNEVASYRNILNRVASVALDGAHSREWLAALASDYERQGDAQRDTGGLAEE
ncbi:MAG TPA: helix-turn-helix transcriptional regulator [Pseudonocardiaceae bacterium]|nr:helix-turn-helix transcriptional regulator [Pseudonocardiaceae bacterium]